MSTLNLTQLAELISTEDREIRRFQLPFPGGRIFVRYFFERECRGSEILVYRKGLDIKCHPGKEFGYEITGHPNNEPKSKECDEPDEALLSYLRENLPRYAAKLLPQPKSF